MPNLAEALQNDQASLRYRKGSSKLPPEKREIIVTAPGFLDPEFYDEQSTIALTDAIEERYDKNHCLLWKDGHGCTAPKQPLGGRLHSCNKLRDTLGEDHDMHNKKAAKYFDAHPELSSWAPYQEQLRKLGSVATKSTTVL